MRIEPEIAGVSLVMLGHFNPAIFTPVWFGWNELLPEKTVKIGSADCWHLLSRGEIGGRNWNQMGSMVV